MSEYVVDQTGTEINKEFCLKRLHELESIEITKIDETPMLNYCAEVFFKSEKSYSEIREVIDNLRSRGYYMMLVIGIRNEMSVIISNLYEKVEGN